MPSQEDAYVGQGEGNLVSTFRLVRGDRAPAELVAFRTPQKALFLSARLTSDLIGPDGMEQRAEDRDLPGARIVRGSRGLVFDNGSSPERRGLPDRIQMACGHDRTFE